ncbi:hypothetical protein LY76DRAFT_588774 [Colletotrichum caudatum]|nr:hypothetical protein LY76DRAFT_588774 [Colletotrichum caudatum]
MNEWEHGINERTEEWMRRDDDVFTSDDDWYSVLHMQVALGACNYNLFNVCFTHMQTARRLFLVTFGFPSSRAETEPYAGQGNRNGDVLTCRAPPRAFCDNPYARRRYVRAQTRDVACPSHDAANHHTIHAHQGLDTADPGRSHSMPTPAIEEGANARDGDPADDDDGHGHPHLPGDVEGGGPEVDGVDVVDCARMGCREAELLHLGA